MPIDLKVLGRPRRDNALFAILDHGSGLTRLMFDCGQGCPDQLSLSDLRGIDHLFFSHFHLDHVCGFDGFFRVNWNRPAPPVYVWGPPGAIDIMHHRLRGFLLYAGREHPGRWIVSEIGEERVESALFRVSERFQKRHPVGRGDRGEVVVDEATYTVAPVLLDHGTVSIGYVVREREYVNIEMSRLDELGLRPGPWLGAVKDRDRDDAEMVHMPGGSFRMGELRSHLLESKPGGSFAYLTDFRITSDAELGRIAAAIQGCDTLVSESQYLDRHLHLARSNNHMTARQAASLAARAGVKRLILFHISERYRDNEMHLFLEEAREIFPQTFFPGEWGAES